MLIITDPRAHVMCTKFTEPKIAVNKCYGLSYEYEDKIENAYAYNGHVYVDVCDGTYGRTK